MAKRYNLDDFSKNRYWWGFFYTENMVDDWKEQIAGIVQKPGEYCLHNGDTEDNTIDGPHRKDHVHLIVAWGGPTTAKGAHKFFERVGAQLSKNGINTFKTTSLQPCENIMRCHKYLIHDTEDSKQKHQYDESERIQINNFDIGAYAQIDITEKEEIIDMICDLIEENDFQDFYELNRFARANFDTVRKSVFRQNQAYFKNVVSGKYLHEKRLREDEQLRKRELNIQEIQQIKEELEEMETRDINE